PTPAEFYGERSRETDHGVFRRRVGRGPWRRSERFRRRDVDDAPTAVAQQIVEARSHERDLRVEVDGEGAPPDLVEVVGVEGGARRDARVVDDDVDRTERSA